MATRPTSSAQHTPGPWHTDWIGTDRVWVLDAEGNYLAEIVSRDECGFAAPEGQQHANARLMAKSPELLEACQELHDFLSDLVENDMLPHGITHTDAANLLVKCLPIFSRIS